MRKPLNRRLQPAEEFAICDFLQAALQNIQPRLASWNNEQRFSFLFSLCTNLVGPFKEADFLEMLERAAQTCGTPGCSCEMEARALFEVFEPMRAKWRERMRPTEDEEL